MKLEQSFEVDAPIEQVWTALIDLEKVAPCLPGAAITGHDDDGTYHGEFQVKLGPTTASYRGTIKIQSADAETRTATLAARGSDKRGQGGASATIVNTLHERDGGGTRVDAETDFTITGRLASFGRGGMMKDISNRLLRDFATCLQQRLAAEPAGDLTADEAVASAGAGAAVEEGDVVAKAPGEMTEAVAAAVHAAAAAARGEADQRLLTVLRRAARPRQEPVPPQAMIAICIAGATGWTGRALVDGVLAADDLELRSAVARSAAGQVIGGAPAYGAVAEALDGVDVLIEFTSHHAAKEHALTAIERGVAVVIGTSGLTAEDFDEIDAAARERGVGVVAAGNFSLTAAMAQAAALLVAPHLPQLGGHRLRERDQGRRPERHRARAGRAARRDPRARARPAARRDRRAASRRAARPSPARQVHSVRLPSFVVSTEVLFGLPDERLSIRHDAGGSPAPYVAGTLLAARAAPERAGLTRGLDTLLLSR